MAAVDKMLEATDVEEVIVMGYCFGGTGVMEVVRIAPKAVIGELMFYIYTTKHLCSWIAMII